MQNWLDNLVEQHKEFESPLSFWKWAGIAAISAAVKDSIWLNRQMFNLYPNIYVMFHADSGLKKGPPVNMAKRLVKATNNTKVITGRASIQGILKELGSQQAYTVPGGKIVQNKATAFICSSELTSSIVEDKIATTILTDLYDRSYNVGEWRSLLKMETFDLKDPTITMLTATNEGHSSSYFERKDITGGYFARTFIIYENEENRSNSLLVPVKNPFDYVKAGEYLKKLSTLQGEFHPLASLTVDDYCNLELRNTYTGEIEFYSEAGLIYEEWYRNFKILIKEVKDPTGTMNRFGESVLKVAMLLSLARAPELYIHPYSMQEAIEICEKLLGNIRKVTVGKGGGEETNASRKTILLQELYNRPNHIISFPQLMKQYWLQGNSDEWMNCIQAFIDAKYATVSSVGSSEGAVQVIKMTDNAVEELKRFYAGKNK